MIGHRLFAVALLAALLPAAPAASWANGPCGSRNNIVERLGKDFSEVPTAAGLANNGVMWEILSSPNGSWTILLTEPSGQSCMIAAGEAWSKNDAASASRQGPEL